MDGQQPDPGRHGMTGRVAVVATIALAFSLTIAASPAASASPVAIEHTLTLPNNSLGGVSCVNATTCFAVGASYSAKFDVSTTFAERWNGRTWSKVPTPNPNGRAFSILGDVSCTSAANCLAVGSSYTKPSGSDSRALAERWNGKTWSIVATPDPDHSALTSVACISATSCFAVGRVIERWNGSAWSTVRTPNIVGLDDVSCTSAINCWAVGGSGSERWNGKSWSPVPMPKTGQEPFESYFVSSVSCRSATMCFAAGALNAPVASSSGLMERWNGETWSIMPAPGPSAAQVTLGGMSCPSSTSCFVLGGTSDSFGGRFRAFTDRWDGTRWSMIASPAFGSGNVTLSGISCANASYCFATGDISQPNLGNLHALIEHWDGNTWSVSGSSAGGAS